MPEPPTSSWGAHRALVALDVSEVPFNHTDGNTSGSLGNVYRGLEEMTYPFHDQTILVTGCGRICFRGRKVNLSHALAGQGVGVTQVGERIWLVTFMHYDLGYFDDETCRLEPIENPFGPKVLPLRLE